MLGEDIKVVFTGGSSNNMHVLIDAPKSVNIARSESLRKEEKIVEKKHYKDREISLEAKEKINEILREERRKAMIR